MGEKRLARLTLGRTHSLSPTDGLETHPTQHGHVYPTTGPRAFRCIITSACPTLTSHSDPAILRTCPPLPLPSISRWIQHDHHVPGDGFRRHTRLWRRRAHDITGGGAAPNTVLHDWRVGEARPHLGREFVTTSSTTKAVVTGSRRRWCGLQPIFFRSFARTVVPLFGRRRRSSNEGCHGNGR